jgi:hypothetical protein
MGRMGETNVGSRHVKFFEPHHSAWPSQFLLVGGCRQQGSSRVSPRGAVMSWSALPGIAYAQGRRRVVSTATSSPSCIQIRVGDLVARQMPMHKLTPKSTEGGNAR